MKRLLFSSVVFTGLVALTASAADYYVATTGDDAAEGTEGAPLATIDAAITKATASTDVIHVAPGTYATTTQYGPNLKAKLVGEGATRDDVIIQSGGSYRTLRMAANSWIENVTLEGEPNYKADKGGVIEMSGGTVTNCIVRNGTANNSGNTEGGCIYMTGDSLVVDSEISGGQAKRRGGNAYVDGGTMRNCVITGGTSANVGGNIFQYAGTITGCTIADGTSVNDGGNVRMMGTCVLSDSTITNGTITTTSDEKKGANVYMDKASKLSRCHLSGGTNAHYNGGSLCVYDSSARVEDCLVEGSACGGVLMGATSYFYNTTIVNNAKYGVWAWSATQHIFNLVVYGNGSDGTLTEWSGNLPSEFDHCATSSDSSRFSTSTYTTLVYVTDDDFVDYANGNYQPKKGGALVDAGTDDPRGSGASTTDLAGNPRTSGTVDIGCYEYQKLDVLVRVTSGTLSQVYAPTTVTFTHESVNSASPENMSFTYDFGDGTTNETTAALSITHAYTTPGVYSITVSATNACEEEYATISYAGYVRVASSSVYVKPGNKAAAFPYDTLETAYASLSAAVNEALDGYTLSLAPGVYESSAQLSVAKAIDIRGLGTSPEEVILRNTSLTPNTYYFRAIELTKAGAILSNVTIENGCVKNQYGGNLHIANGACVSNCVIRGGRAVADNGNAAGGAVDIGGSNAILTHSIITNNTVSGASNDKNYAGGAIFIEYGAKNAHLSNLLIADNVYIATNATEAGTAGIRFGGGNDWTTVENCTIASNTVVGALSDDSAGLYCTSWHCLLYNNIIVGNFETEKNGGSFTSVKLDTNGGSNYKYFCNVTDDALIGGSATKSVGNLLVTDRTALFQDFAGGDFTLRTTAPACNAGTTSSLALLPSVDLAGNPRVFGKAIDIGCYECQRKPGFSVVVR